MSSNSSTNTQPVAPVKPVALPVKSTIDTKAAKKTAPVKKKGKKEKREKKVAAPAKPAKKKAAPKVSPKAAEPKVMAPKTAPAPKPEVGSYSIKVVAQTEGHTRWVPIGSLRLDEDLDPRVDRSLDTPEELEKFGRHILTDSKEVFGHPPSRIQCLQLPLVVPASGKGSVKDGESFTVFDGRRRVRAILETTKNLKAEVLVTVLPATKDKTTLGRVAYAGFERKGLSPVQLAIYGHRVVRALLRKQQGGVDPTEAQIAKWLDVAPQTWANTLLPLAKASQEIQDLVSEKYLSLNTYRANKVLLETYPEIAGKVVEKLREAGTSKPTPGTPVPPAPGTPAPAPAKRGRPRKESPVSSREAQAIIDQTAREKLGTAYTPTKESRVIANPPSAVTPSSPAVVTAPAAGRDCLLAAVLVDIADTVGDATASIKDYGAYLTRIADFLREGDTSSKGLDEIQTFLSATGVSFSG